MRMSAKAALETVDLETRDRLVMEHVGLGYVEAVKELAGMAGMAVHVVLITASMTHDYFCNADGEMLVVAEQGRLRFRTEFGVIEIEPGEDGFKKSVTVWFFCAQGEAP